MRRPRPAPRLVPMEPDKSHALGAGMGTPLPLLIVEDSEDDALIAVRALRRAGLEPEMRRVQTAAELAAALLQGTWKAVLADYRLPQFNGMEALEMVRGAGLDVPFILVSGAIGEETAAAIMKAGANDFVSKDDLSRLAPALQRELREAEVRTSHRRSQRELAASEERYRLLFRGSTLSLWVYDIETLRFLDVNDAACLRYGYSREEFLALTLRDIRPPEDVAALERDVAPDRIPRSGPRVRRHRLRDGSLIDVEIYSHNIAYLGRAARFVSAIDVTQRLRAEREIRRLSLAIEQSPAATLITDTEGRIEYANPRFIEASGYSAAELVGNTPALVKSGFTPARVYEDLWKTIKSGAPWRGVIHNRRKSGELYWEDTTIAPLLDEAGVMTHFVAVKEDITARLAAEEEVRSLNAGLERRIEERTRELQAANRELEAFSHSVSHDLRAPLVAMKSFAGVLEEAGADRLRDEDRHYLARIRAAAERMEHLIDDLLSLSRVSRAHVVTAGLDLTALALGVAAELREGDPGRAATITVAPGMRARGDAGLLRIALTNLLANAWKFSSRKDAVVIEVGIDSETPEATSFFVRDEGAGFDGASAGRLFAAFSRLHTEAQFPGTGMGLAIVRRVIERHGGSVRAEGTPGRGATFWFVLPNGERHAERGEAGPEAVRRRSA